MNEVHTQKDSHCAFSSEAAGSLLYFHIRNIFPGECSDDEYVKNTK